MRPAMLWFPLLHFHFFLFSHLSNHGRNTPRFIHACSFSLGERRGPAPCSQFCRRRLSPIQRTCPPAGSYCFREYDRGFLGRGGSSYPSSRQVGSTFFEHVSLSRRRCPLNPLLQTINDPPGIFSMEHLNYFLLAGKTIQRARPRPGVGFISECIPASLDVSMQHRTFSFSHLRCSCINDPPALSVTKIPSMSIVLPLRFREAPQSPPLPCGACHRARPGRMPARIRALPG